MSWNSVFIELWGYNWNTITEENIAILIIGNSRFYGIDPNVFIDETFSFVAGGTKLTLINSLSSFLTSRARTIEIGAPSS